MRYKQSSDISLERNKSFCLSHIFGQLVVIFLFAWKQTMATSTVKLKSPSTDQSTDISFNIDLSLFETANYNDSCKDINCESIRRLIHTLSYYSKLDIINNEKHCNLFEHFMNDTYHQFINDFIHLVHIHSDKIYEINQSISKNKLLQDCDIKKCDCTMRHHNGTISTEGKQENDGSIDLISNCYKREVDSLHFYVMHLFDCGLRVHNEYQEEINNDRDNDGKVDKQFQRILKTINERKEATLLSRRFKNNTKFNLTVKEKGKLSVSLCVKPLYFS